MYFKLYKHKNIFDPSKIFITQKTQPTDLPNQINIGDKAFVKELQIFDNLEEKFYGPFEI